MIHRSFSCFVLKLNIFLHMTSQFDACINAGFTFVNVCEVMVSCTGAISLRNSEKCRLLKEIYVQVYVVKFTRL